METSDINNIKIEREHALELLYQMLRIREFEDKCAEMYTQSKIRGFLHLYNGEEAVAVGVMQALGAADFVLATYREHGHALARGLDMNALMAEMYGKKEGCSGGRGGSMHIFDVKNNFFGGNAIVAGHLPLAVGMALASRKLQRDNITCCFFGEGAVAEGEFHEALNLAALWQVPVLFVCENNLYAMGTAIRFSHASTAIEKKGAVYNIETMLVDGMDVLAVEEAAKKAVAYIKTSGKPFFIVCDTYRFRAHSMFDAELYREKSEVEEWKKRDPILNYQNKLLDTGMIKSDESDKLRARVTEELRAAVDFAEAGTEEPVEELLKFVCSGKTKDY